jgi:hypothetical protein
VRGSAHDLAGIDFAPLVGPSRPELQINAANASIRNSRSLKKKKRAIFLMLALNFLFAALAC